MEPMTENPALIPHAQAIASFIRSETICSPAGKKSPNQKPSGAIDTIAAVETHKRVIRVKWILF